MIDTEIGILKERKTAENSTGTEESGAQTPANEDALSGQMMSM
ncbi:hypothetical protein [Mucilaginibacter gracilis]|nr:hypothetical protein [Mucilaginibacter gracilis]